MKTSVVTGRPSGASEVRPQAPSRWRLYAFADADERAWRAMLDWLATGPDSPIAARCAAGGDIDALVDVRGIVQRPAHDTAFTELPSILRPTTGRLGLLDCEKAFAATVAPGTAAPDIYDLRGIDRTTGALVVVRPDQYVAQVLPLDAITTLRDFLASVLPDEDRSRQKPIGSPA